MRISIVGGGIAGSVAAMLLADKGHNVALWESRKYTGNDNYSRTGGIIGITYQAMSVLAQFDIMPSEYTMGPSTMKWHKVNRRRIVESEAMPFPGHNTTWTRLHSILRKATVGVRRIDRITGYDGKRLYFHSGHIAKPEMVIWADGIRSYGRRLLDPERQTRYANYVAFRGLPTMDEHSDWQEFKRYARNGAVVGMIGTDWALYRNMPPVTFKRLFGGRPNELLFVRSISDEAYKVAIQTAQFLPFEQYRAIAHTPRNRLALLPIVDSDIPKQAVFELDTVNVLLGDALSNVRPHTAMGANLGIIGASVLAKSIENYESSILPLLETQILRGQRLGRISGLGVKQ